MAFQFNQGDRPLPGYTIQRGIGRGGFGEVYYAVSDGGKEVALKYLRENPQVELRGVQHCLNLKSPYLVAIHDVKQNAGGDFFVIMEYVNGLSLRDLMTQEPKGLGQQKAAYFLREIGKGLAYLHDRGIVHRDLKPGNIFYEDGYVKIGDYGLSKLMAASQHSGQTVSVGTVHYMAPEVGSGNYDRTIDIYAMGVMLYEMLLGRVPFSGSSMGEVLMKHLTAQPEVDELPAPFPQVIRKALAKDPRDRYQSIEDMVSDIFSADDLDRSVAAFEPASLTMLAAKAAAGLRTADQGVAAFGTGSSNVGGIVTPPPIMADERRARRQPPPPVPHAFAPMAPDTSTLPYGGWVSDPAAVVPAVTGALSAMAAAAVASTVLGHRHFEFGIGVMLHGMSILAGAWLWRWWTSHYLKTREDWTGTLSFAAIVGVLFFLTNRLCTEAGLVSHGTETWVPPMLAAFVICDWRSRLADGAKGVVSSGPAFWVGLFGFVAAKIAPGDDWVPVSAMLAGASLALQMLGRMWPASSAATATELANDAAYRADQMAPNWPEQQRRSDSAPPGVALSRDGAASAAADRAFFGAAAIPEERTRQNRLEPRAHGVRTLFAVLAVLFLIAAILTYSVPAVAGVSPSEYDVAIVVGQVLTNVFLFCLVTAIPAYKHGLWRGYLRQAVFFTGAAMSSAGGAAMGLLPLYGEEKGLTLSIVIVGGVIMLGVWFIPVPPYDPAASRARAAHAEGDVRRGIWLRNSGIVLLGIGVLLTPILMLSLSSHDYENVLPPTLIPIGVLGISLIVAGVASMQASAKKEKPHVRLELPLRRDFRIADTSRLESNLDRHAVIFDYTLRRRGDLIWAYQRGDWMSHLIQSDVRRWKTTFTVAVYDLPDGAYRVSCLLDLDAPWNSASKSMLRKLDDELRMFGESICAVEMSRVPAEVSA